MQESRGCCAGEAVRGVRGSDQQQREALSKGINHSAQSERWATRNEGTLHGYTRIAGRCVFLSGGVSLHPSSSSLSVWGRGKGALVGGSVGVYLWMGSSPTLLLVRGKLYQKI
ncbi:hypothetical protein E2C01_097179 [Portunus trituberculatus]|uniref:Uncharacterized protein n=1 Tax=Portunus trituberculatus TaxID=210409 RepID=A0A5B7JZT0_PORTR|nr:hypothetical protein [Portunus trituberculatus]